MTLEDFRQASFLAADNKTVISQKPLLIKLEQRNVGSVYVRGQSTRFSNDPKDLVLLSFPVNLTSDAYIPESYLSLVISKDGNILATSENNIGYRVGFFGNPKEPQSQITGSLNPQNDTIYGPVRDVLASLASPPYTAAGNTDADGQYVIPYVLPICPLGGFEFTTDIWVKLNYKNFLPTGLPQQSYHLRKQEWDYCYATLTPLTGTYKNFPPNTSSLRNRNFLVDVMFLSGLISLENHIGDSVKISSSEPTNYTAFDEQAQSRAQQFYDFNSDGVNDTVVSGRFTTTVNPEGQEVEIFESQKEDIAEFQGVFLDGSQQTPEDLPDFVRLIDQELRNEPIGTLKTINQADLRNTDVLFFRESTGQLIMERRGLKEEEAKGTRSVATGFNEESNEVAYRIMLRGAKDLALNIGGGFGRARLKGFQQWATANMLEEPFQERKSDHIRPGEYIKIVAINRATGYVGTTRVQLQGLAQNSGGGLNIESPKIVMQPPNLKIWAERNFDIKDGLNKGDNRTQLIGAEGASLTSDTTITVYTEWLDENGEALPEELGLDNGEQYGLTGRFAQVVGTGSLRATGGGDLAEFPIAPGRNTQILNVGSNLSSAQHYYVHVIGKPKDQECVNNSSCPSFRQLGASAPYDTRPALLTPFMVPLFDEDKSWQTYNAYRQLQREYDDPDNANPPAVDPEKPLPSYVWQYRPEYQFSQYGLEVQELNRIATNNDGEETATNILDTNSPVIDGSDTALEALYSLVSSNFERLNSFDGEQELILALGQEEQRITLGEDRTIRFDNIDHLAGLSPEDFLAMRLYTNNDAGNVLWEYAFHYLQLFPSRNNELTEDDNRIEITADQIGEGSQAITAFLDGIDENDILRWQRVGDGTLSKRVETSTTGIFSTTLTLPPITGSSASVSAFLGDTNNRAISPTFVVIAGEPHTITTTQQGKTVIGGLGEITLDITIKDKYGNNVEDGTIVSVDSTYLTINNNQTTVDGKLSIAISGASVAGEQNITIRAGNAETTKNVTVHDVTVNFANLADQEINTNKTLAIEATSDYGNLDGLVIDLAAHRGKLSQTQVVLDNNSRATVNYDSGRYRGFAQVSAKISGTSTFISDAFNIIETGDYLESNMLVTGGDGSISLSNGKTLNYSASTQLVVNAAPGEVITSSLIDIFEPPIYALQDYNPDAPQAINPLGNSVVLDYSSGIDATANNISLININDNKKYNLAMSFNTATVFDIPSHSRTNNLNEAGINFWIKVPDLTSINDTATLVDWDDFGLQLSINSQGQLSATTTTDANSYTITHPDALNSGEWHHIALHQYNNELRLGIDQTETKTAISGAKQVDQESYALRIQGDSALSNFQITGVKLYDWAGESKLTFANGGMDTTATADSTGIAKVGITAQAPLLAYTRPYHQPPQTLYAHLGDFVIPNAYAAVDALEACRNTFDPIPDNAPDPDIAEAERFLRVILECVVKPKVEEAVVHYETSNGIFKKSAAFINKKVYEGVYSTLNRNVNNALVVANCLDAVVTGGNSSAVGTTCDFITSLLAIGDLRDILIQSWHYNFGDRENYDSLTANLAAIGLLADGVSLTGVGTAPATVVNVLAASGKTLAKAYKSIGPTGVRAAKLVGEQLGIIVQSTGTFTQKADKLKAFVPFFEVSISLSLVRQEAPDLFPFLAEAVTSPQTLTNLAQWFSRYVTRLETELDIVAEQQRSRVLGFFFPSAYAALSKNVQAKLVADLAKLLDGIPVLKATATTKEVAVAFNQSIATFLRQVELDTFPFKSVTDEMQVVRAFVAMQFIDADLVKRVAKLGNYTLGLNSTFTSELFVKTMAEFPYQRIIFDIGEDAAQKGMKKVVQQFDSTVFNFTKGAVAHYAVLADLLADNSRVIKIKKIEELVDGADLGLGKNLSKRRLDLQVEIDGKLFDIEIKNFQSNTWKNNLDKMMSFDAVAKNDNFTAGQLFNDIVAFEKGVNKRYMFMPDIGASADDVLDHIADLMLTGKNSKNLQSAFELTGISRKDWDIKVKSILTKMKDEKFIEINSLENLIL